MSIREIEDTRPRELEVLVEAHRKNIVDSMYLESFAAWQNRQVNLTRKNGRYVVTEFKDLFDYEQTLEDLKGNKSDKTERFNRKALSRIAELNNR
ncbi:hypothetical protein [uncultured Finegoldia sp.]|uniref:hypothetical protein n=1 Tax=uncultured Finegoldia sp. TaxID=328009 RepID=UPI002803B4E9|nr:hypothetical protein [uncultured Finegoldia sp.]MDU1409780.1 hypothetical protein [Veillonella sp.]